MFLSEIGIRAVKGGAAQDPSGGEHAALACSAGVGDVRVCVEDEKDSVSGEWMITRVVRGLPPWRLREAPQCAWRKRKPYLGRFFVVGQLDN